MAPTFYELADVNYPEFYREKEVYPLKGTSLLPFVSGKTEEIHPSNYVFALEHSGHRMLRKGHWKITNYIRPFSMENFALYDISNDTGEQNDLKEMVPEKYEELIAEWNKFSDNIKLQIPAPYAN